MTSKRTALARGCLSLVLAGAAFGANAQHQPLPFALDESLSVTVPGVSSDAGNTQYYFDVQQGATDLRVALTNANLFPGASIVVREFSPDGMVLCNGQHIDGNVVCLREGTLQAGRYYIDVATGQGQVEVLDAAFIPAMQSVTTLPAHPFQLANREVFHTTAAPTCLESNVDGTPLDEAQCLPMGNQQQWAFEALDGGNFRIRNMQSNVCLEARGTDIGAPISEALCETRTTAQTWHVFGAGGYTHYAYLVNMGANRCLDFRDGQAVLVDCGDVAPNAPAWTLRDDADRIDAEPVTGGGLAYARGGLCMSDENHYVMLGDCANAANARYTFAPAYAFGGAGGPGDGTFVMTSNDSEPARCVVVEAMIDGVRRAEMADCRGNDPGQRWTLVASASDWQMRNEFTGECLAALDGSHLAGTPLVTTACSPWDDRTRWSYTK